MADPNAGVPAPPSEPLGGYLDWADWRHISGWAYNPDCPAQSLWLHAVIDDAPPLRFLANLFRQDLLKDGIGTGRYGFYLRFPTPLDARQSHTVVVSRASDGALLTRSPVHLSRAPSASPWVRAKFNSEISAEIEAAQSGPELEPMTRFLIAQTDRLLQARTDRDNGALERTLFRLRWDEYLDGPRTEPPTPPDSRPRMLLIGATLPVPGEPLLAAAAILNLRIMATAGDLAMPDKPHPVFEALGAPLHFTVEDVLKRNAGQFSAVLLRGASLAASYGLTARRHQPGARIVAWIDDPSEISPMLTLCAMLLADTVLVPRPEDAKRLGAQIVGRGIAVLSPETSPAQAAVILAEAINPGGVVYRSRI